MLPPFVQVSYVHTKKTQEFSKRDHGGSGMPLPKHVVRQNVMQPTVFKANRGLLRTPEVGMGGKRAFPPNELQRKWPGFGKRPEPLYQTSGQTTDVQPLWRAVRLMTSELTQADHREQ